MRIAYFDCFAGVAGDMIVGALLDAGLEFCDLESELGKLGVSGYEMTAARTERNGISGTEFRVETDEGETERTAAELVHIVEGSALDVDVKTRSAEILRDLARVEAGIHGKAVEEIHLHELGGLDTIVDVVAAIVGLRKLGIDAVYASRIHVGTGFVECRHGTLPVPAPATMALLEGIPVRSLGIESELATPTGVAILKGLAESFGPLPPMRVSATGYGAGSRALPIPNLLRVSLGDLNDEHGADEILVVETNIDDMNPEFFGHVSELLLARGALDVYTTPVLMKKNRPGMVLSVLAPPDMLDEITGVLFTETTTLGIRIDRVARRKVPRETMTVETRFGRLTAKVSRFRSGAANIAPEYEDCRRAALGRGVPLRDVYEAVAAAVREALSASAVDGPFED